MNEFEKKMWWGSTKASFYTLVFALLYVLLQSGTLTDGLALARVAALSGAILLGLSFALSSLGYFFDLFDKYVVYRKYVGLWGFFFAFLHSVILLFVYPEHYFYGFFANLGSLDFFYGLTGMVILAYMALISNEWGLRVLGPEYWRKSLRLGYLAYFLFTLRAIDMEGEEWLRWIAAPTTLPPVRLFMSVLALIVIFFRGAAGFSSARQKSAEAKRLAPAVLPDPAQLPQQPQVQ